MFYTVIIYGLGHIEAWTWTKLPTEIRGIMGTDCFLTLPRMSSGGNTPYSCARQCRVSCQLEIAVLV